MGPCLTACRHRRLGVKRAALLAMYLPTDCTESCSHPIAAPASFHQQTRWPRGDLHCGHQVPVCCHAGPRCWQTATPMYSRQPPSAPPPATPAASAMRGSGAPTMAAAPPSSAALKNRSRRRPATCKRRSWRPATQCLGGGRHNSWQATTGVRAMLHQELSCPQFHVLDCDDPAEAVGIFHAACSSVSINE